MGTRIGTALASACALFALAPASAGAATLSVSCGAASLRAALVTTNANGQDDVVELDPGCSYMLGSAPTPGELVVSADAGHRLEIRGRDATLDGGDATRILRVDAGAFLTLSQATLKHGHAEDGVVPGPPGAAGVAQGGGAIANEGTVFLDRVVLSENRAGDGAPGLQGTPAMAGGDAGDGGDGGAVHSHGVLDVRGSTFRDNTAGEGGTGGAGGGAGGGRGGEGGHAGAIWSGGPITVSGTELSDNAAGNGGLGGDDSGSGNAGRGGDGGDGGALHADGSATLANVTLAASGAGGGGHGGQAATGASGSGGRGGSGGAIASGGVLELTNATLAGNAAGPGGGGGFGGPVLPPPPPGGGGGIGGGTGGGTGGGGPIAGLPGPSGGGSALAPTGTATARNTIVAGAAACFGAVADGGSNLEPSGTSCGFANATGDPQLGPLQANGGPTKTMAPALGGAAIDTGDDAACAAAVGAPGLGAGGNDQRGVQRPQGAHCDIGAFELERPAVTLSRSTVAFTARPVGTTSPHAGIVVVNAGGAPLTGITPQLGGGAGGQFVIASQNCAGAVVAPGGTCTVEVVYSPTAAGTHAETLTITSNAHTSPDQVALAGTAVAPASVAVSPTSVGYPPVPVGTAVPPVTATLTNSGGSALTVSALMLSGAHAGDFDVVGETCTAAAIPPGGTCDVDLAFAPTAGGVRSAALDIATNAPGSPHSVPLTGVGVTPLPPPIPVQPGAGGTPGGGTTPGGTTPPDAAAAGAEATPADGVAAAERIPPHAEVVVLGAAQLRRSRDGRPLLLSGLGVRCPAGLPLNCGGSGRVRASVDSSDAARRRAYTVAKLGFAARSGHTRQVKLRLTNRGLRILRRTRRLRVTMSLVTRGARGARVVTPRTVLLRLP